MAVVEARECDADRGAPMGVARLVAQLEPGAARDLEKSGERRRPGAVPSSLEIPVSGKAESVPGRMEACSNPARAMNERRETR